MNAPLAFQLAHEALTGRGGHPPEPPKRRARRLSRVLLLATATIAILLATLGADALGDPAPSGAMAQPGGDRLAGVASTKKKRSADKQRGRGKRAAKKKGGSGKAGVKKGDKPGTKNKGGKAGPKKKGGGKAGPKKNGHGKPKARDNRLDLYYTAKIKGTDKYEYTNNPPDDDPDVEYTGTPSGNMSASLRAARASVQLSRELITDPNTKRTIRYYGFALSASGELLDGASTYIAGGWRSKRDASGCAEGQTVLGTEFGPSPIALQVTGTLGLPRQGPRIAASREGPPSGATATVGSVTCTRADGTPYPSAGPTTLTGNSVLGPIPLSCNYSTATGGHEVTSVASGKVAWGKAFTISVTCAEKFTSSLSSFRGETRLTIAMTPCPRRANRPCQ